MKLAELRHAFHTAKIEQFAALKPRLSALYDSLENRTERYIIGRHLIDDLRIQGDINDSYAGDLADLLTSATLDINSRALMRETKAYLEKDIDTGVLRTLVSGDLRVYALKYWVSSMMRSNDISGTTFLDMRDSLALALHDAKAFKR